MNGWMDRLTVSYLDVETIKGVFAGSSVHGEVFACRKTTITEMKSLGDS